VYEVDTGEVFAIEHSIESTQWLSFAHELFTEGFNIRVVDQTSGAVVYTLENTL
jgi:hypothetical protein